MRTPVNMTPNPIQTKAIFFNNLDVLGDIFFILIYHNTKTPPARSHLPFTGEEKFYGQRAKDVIIYEYE